MSVKKRITALLLTLLMLMGMLAAGCNSPQNNNVKKKIPKPPADKQVRIAIALSPPGRGDKATNDLALAGLERAKSELGIEYTVIEPGELVDEEETVRYLAENNYDLVITVGFPMVKPLEKVAPQYPDINFAILDETVDKPNVTSINFREQEGSFLAGALAGTLTRSNITGFIGGADLDLIHKYEAGFKQGVAYINDTEKKNVRVLSGYLGVTTDAFKDPQLGTAMANMQIGLGADIIYHAARGASQGIIDAAKAGNRLIIGSDINQNDQAPGLVYASMIKKTDEAVFQTIDKLIKGELPHGTVYYGLAEKGLGIEYTAGVPQEIIDKINGLEQKIQKGEIKVADKADDAVNTKVNAQVTQIIQANPGQNPVPNTNPAPAPGVGANPNPSLPPPDNQGTEKKSPNPNEEG